MCVRVCVCTFQQLNGTNENIQEEKVTNQSNPCQSLCSESYSSSTPTHRTPSNNIGVPWCRSEKERQGIRLLYSNHLLSFCSRHKYVQHSKIPFPKCHMIKVHLHTFILFFYYKYLAGLQQNTFQAVTIIYTDILVVVSQTC